MCGIKQFLTLPLNVNAKYQRYSFLQVTFDITATNLELNISPGTVNNAKILEHRPEGSYGAGQTHDNTVLHKST